MQRTALGIPWVEDADHPITYPTTSQELATDLETLIQPVRGDAGFSVSGSGSGITVFTCVSLLLRPALVKFSLSWTHGSTSVAAGDNTFWVGTINTVAWRPLRITTGTLRKNAGAGIVQIGTDGKLEIKWLSSTLPAAQTVYCDATYEVSPMLSVLRAAAAAPGIEARPA